MTQAEISIKNALNGVWELCRHYSEGEETGDFPEILDIIANCLEETNARLTRVVDDEREFPDNRYIIENRIALEADRDELERLVEDIKTSDVEFYAVADTPFSYLPEVLPITEERMPLYKASVGKGGVPNFEANGGRAATFIVPESCTNTRKRALIAPNTYRNRPIYAEQGFAGFGYLYLDPKEDPSFKYFICKDCGEVYVMHISQIIFFRKKGLKIPKRCVACRERRRRKP